MIVPREKAQELIGQTDFQYKDLEIIPKFQFLWELFLPLPWLAVSLALYASPLWFLGPFATFYFFLCCLRLNHEAIHSNLGLKRRWDHVIMHGLSGLMIGSNHADAFCHLKHHADTMGHDDHEGHCARMSMWQVLLYGPKFPIDLNLATWKQGGAKWQRRILIDWVCVAALLVLALGSGWAALQLHILVMLIGQCLTAFFAVWITHWGTEETGLAGRSQRGAFAWLAYQMFYHREHHLFPRVPVSRLAELGRRLDEQVEGYADSHQAIVPTREVRAKPI